MTDLFGRPIYDSPPAVQPPLFGDRHYFRIGYCAAVRGTPRYRRDREYGENAYQCGYDAGIRDLRAGAEADESAAWRANVAVGNVREG